MAVTRREFVTTLGLLAGAVGMGQADLAKVVEAFGHGAPWSGGGWTKKPKVIWVHGAECTGCSVSLLSLFEDARGVALPAADNVLGVDVPTATALALVAGDTLADAVKLNEPLGATHGGPVNYLIGASTMSPDHGHRTLENAGIVDSSVYAVTVADVLIDFIDLQYHETIMAMGGDSAYAYLADAMDAVDAPFVLVVEGAVQGKGEGGYWNKQGSTPWCSIAMDGREASDPARSTTPDLSFDEVVESLAAQDTCKAVVAIGQCASFGGYPACVGPDLVPRSDGAGGYTPKGQTGAKGVHQFLTDLGYVAGNEEDLPAAADKVINVPGCPANPWWFTLTVVAWLVDAVTATAAGVGGKGALGLLNNDLSLTGAGVDTQRRLTAVYGHLLHGKYCPRYPYYAARVFASKPGDEGCLKNIGCKGISTQSLCGRHGWNAQQPQNSGMNSAVEALAYKSTDGVTKLGGFCMTAGAPCMGCTEKGYPDAFTPFVTL